MVTIKVTFGSSVHKFNIPADSTWASFESNLRTLFKIPDNYKIIASYTDEDKDVITLSSDIEFREVLNHHSNDTNTSVRLVLNAVPTSNNLVNKEMEETFEKMTIVDDEKCCATETETETERECDETCEKSTDEKCCEGDDTAQSSSDPEIYFIVRNRSRRRPRFGYAKFDSSENNSERCQFVRGEFDPSYRQHHHQPHGGLASPFGSFGPFNHHGGPHHFGPNRRGPCGFNGHPPPPAPPGEFGSFGPYNGGFVRFHHGHGHDGRGFRCNRETGGEKEKECQKDEKECKDEKDTNDPRVERDNHATPCHTGLPGYAFHGPHSSHHPRSRSPHEGRRRGPRMHGMHGMHGHWHAHHPGFHGRRRRHHHHHGDDTYGHHHQHKPLTPEELAEKVALLNSMNFPSDKNEHYEKLLKKCQGRIGRVVEILLCERKRKDGEEPGDDNSDDGGNNDDINDFEEIKEPSSPTII